MWVWILICGVTKLAVAKTRNLVLCENIIGNINASFLYFKIVPILIIRCWRCLHIGFLILEAAFQVVWTLGIWFTFEWAAKAGVRVWRQRIRKHHCCWPTTFSWYRFWRIIDNHIHTLFWWRQIKNKKNKRRGDIALWLKHNINTQTK